MVSTTTTGTGGTGTVTVENVPPAHERTGWTGWIIFAAVVMMIGGALEAVSGFIAAVNDTWVVWTNQGRLYLDFSTWGWVHLGLGCVVFLAGLGVLSGHIIGRIVGVTIASLALIGNFLFIPAYPLWAITLCALDVLVIWALTAHGSEMRSGF